MTPALILGAIILLPLYMIPISMGMYIGKVWAIRLLFGKK